MDGPGYGLARRIDGDDSLHPMYARLRGNRSTTTASLYPMAMKSSPFVHRVVTSSTLSSGSPVTLNFSVSLAATGYFSGRPTAFNSEYRVDANYMGAVDDISPGATGSQYTGINGSGVLNFPFNTFVGTRCGFMEYSIST